MRKFLRLLVPLLLLFWATRGHAAISDLSATVGCKAASTTCTLGTTTAGQLLIAHAWDTSAATAPTLPAGWTNIDNSTGNTVGERFACKVAAGSDTTGTWTNATLVIVTVYSGTAAGRTENCPFTMARLGAAGGASSATIAYNTFTFFDKTGTSWVEGCAAHRTASNLTAPTGMTATAGGTIGAGPQALCSNTNGAVSSWSTTSTGVNATSGWRSETIAILAPCPTSPCFDVFLDMNTGTAGDNITTTNLAAGTFFGIGNLNATPWAAPTAGVMSIQNHTAGVRELGGTFTADDGTTTVGSGHASKPMQYANATAGVFAEAIPPSATFHLVSAAGWVTIGAATTNASPSLWDLIRHDTIDTGHFVVGQYSQATNKCSPNAGIDEESDPNSVTTNSTCYQFSSVPQTVWMNVYYDATGTATTGVAKLAVYDTCANGGTQLLLISNQGAGADTGAGNGIAGTLIGNAEAGTDASNNFFENWFLMYDRNALTFPVGPNCTASSSAPPATQMSLGVGE